MSKLVVGNCPATVRDKGAATVARSRNLRTVKLLFKRTPHRGQYGIRANLASLRSEICGRK